MRVFSFIALALVVAASARAQDDGLAIAVIAVAKDSPSSGPAVVAGQITRQAFERSPRYAVIDIERVLNGGADESRLATLKRAQDALERGQAAYDAFELDPALEALAEAIVSYEQVLGLATDLRPIVDALVYQGAAFALKGDVKNAKASFVRAATLDPALAVEDGRFPDTVVAILDDGRAAAQKLPTGSLTVYASPAAAEVWIDGGFRGSAPLTVDELPQGRHYVRVVRDGYVAFGEAVDVARGKEETVQATLRPTTSLAKYDDLRSKLVDDDGSAAAEIAKTLKVDQLLTVVVESSGDEVKLKGRLTDGIGGGTLAEGEKSFSTSQARYRGDLEVWVNDTFRKEGSAQAANGSTTTGPKESFMPDKPVAPPTPGLLIAGYVVTGLSVIPVALGWIVGIVALVAWDVYRNQGQVLAMITGDGSLGVPDQVTAGTNQQAQVFLALLGVTSIAHDIFMVLSWIVLGSGITMIVFGTQQKAEIEDVLSRALPEPPSSRVARAGLAPSWGTLVMEVE